MLLWIKKKMLLHLTYTKDSLIRMADASAPQIPKPQLGGGNRLPQMVGARPKRSINQKKLEEWKKVIQREKGPTGESAVTASPPRPPRKLQNWEEPTGSSGGI